MTTIDQQFIEYIVKSLVSNPDDVVIERRIDEKGVLLELTVNAEDLGRVIGKRGITAQSLRTLLRALGTKNDARYNLKIVNNDGDERPARQEKPAEQEEKIEDTTPSAAERDQPVQNSDTEDVENESDLTKNTRKELAELDDLDI